VYDPEWAVMNEAQREQCREWLRSAGGNPHETQAVRVEGEGTVIAEVVTYDEYGGVEVAWGAEPPFWPRPALHDVLLTAATMPPWWKADFFVHV